MLIKPSFFKLFKTIEENVDFCLQTVKIIKIEERPLKKV